MKALIISDNQDVLNNVTPLLKKNNYDIIHYRWIIKAIDNIEEIQPDIIVVSAEEYPRHWKTLAGYIQSGIGGNEINLYLYDMTFLSDEDAGKALELDVKGFFDYFDDQNSGKGAAKISEPSFDFSTVENPTENNIDVQIALNASESDSFNFASGRFFPDSNYLEYNSSKPEFSDGDFIKFITVCDGEKTSSFSAVVQKSKTNFEGYELQVKQYYEKEI